MAHVATPRAGTEDSREMIRRASSASRHDRLRLFIVGLSIVALSAILVLVEGIIPRILLGAVAMAFLTWSACTWGRQPRAQLGLPSGLRERRSKHVLRHRVNEFLRSVRRLDRIARGASEGNVTTGTAEDAISEIYRSLDDLTRQIRVLAGRNT